VESPLKVSERLAPAVIKKLPTSLKLLKVCGMLEKVTEVATVGTILCIRVIPPT
jgi:hypothetical protein